MQELGPRSFAVESTRNSLPHKTLLAIAGIVGLVFAGCGVTAPRPNSANNPAQSNSSSASSSGSGQSGSTSGSGSGGSDPTGTTSTGTGVYGSATNADALNNITIGPHVVSYRFLSRHTGTVSAVHLFLIVHGPHAGYNSGTGGTLKVQLETDDGSSDHQPSGKILGTYTIPQPQNPFPVIALSPAPKLQAGTFYHLVFSNTDPNPNENFVSVDNLYMEHPLNPMQPGYSNEHLATLIQDSPNSWSVYNFNTPVFELDFTDGASFGQGYMEVWVGAPEPISSANAVRETFTVTGGDKAVTSVAVRVARTSGSGDLTVRLEQDDGNVVEQGAIPSAAIPLSSSEYTWATYNFSAMRTLLDGQTYHLDFEAPSGTTYQTYPVRKGSAEAFQPTTFFRDGHAEFKSNGSWSGWTQWGQTNRTDGDLQFYFDVVN